MATPANSLGPMSYSDIRALTAGPPSARDAQQAAAQFESLFIDRVLKSMREANAVLSEGSYLSSSEVEAHQEMLDHQMAIHLSDNGGLGLRALIQAQLEGPVTESGAVLASSSQASARTADNPS